MSAKSLNMMNLLANLQKEIVENIKKELARVNRQVDFDAFEDEKELLYNEFEEYNAFTLDANDTLIILVSNDATKDSFDLEEEIMYNNFPTWPLVRIYDQLTDMSICDESFFPFTINHSAKQLPFPFMTSQH